jgi:hypothetical protein
VVWWISGVIAVLGLFVLIAAGMTLWGRMGRLRRIERSLRVRADQAKQLEEPVLALQRRAVEMQEVALRIQKQVEARAARKAADES